MNRHTSNNIDRLYDLLADRALVGLSPEEERTLNELLILYPHVREDEFDRTVAMLDVVTADCAALPVPPSLGDRLRSMVGYWQGDELPANQPGQREQQTDRDDAE